MDEFWDEFLGTWWGKVIMSLVLLALAWGLFVAFTKAESGEEVGGRVRWYIAIAYYVGGKWVVSGFFAICGVILGITGIRQAINKEE